VSILRISILAKTFSDIYIFGQRTYHKGSSKNYTWTGLPDFPWYNIPKREKIYQITIKYTKWPQSIPNGHKIYQNIPSQVPPQFTQIIIFGLKIYQLATMHMDIKADVKL
jgi:hypothetical protein